MFISYILICLLFLAFSEGYQTSFPSWVCLKATHKLWLGVINDRQSPLLALPWMQSQESAKITKAISLKYSLTVSKYTWKNCEWLWNILLRQYYCTEKKLMSMTHNDGSFFKLEFKWNLLNMISWFMLFEN